MRLIIHDLNIEHNEKIKKLFSDEKRINNIISNNGNIKHCIGCFNCWVKTPGECVLKDGYNEMGKLAGGSKELIIISKCVYGTYSPFVKNVLDRLISYVHPDFTMRNGEMHHKLRYTNSMSTKVYFYGDITESEKETARKLVKANLINFNGSLKEVKFLESFEEVFNENSIN